VVVRSISLFYNLTPKFSLAYLYVLTFHFIIDAFFTKPFSPYLETCRYHLSLFRYTTVIISSAPNLCQVIILESICYFITMHPPNSHLSLLSVEIRIIGENRQ